MDLVRLVLPNEDVRELMPLAALGFVDTTLTDDILRNRILAEECNLLGHLRVSLREYELAHPKLQGSPLIIMDLLKVCLDKRSAPSEKMTSRLLTQTLPIILSHTILGVSFYKSELLLPLNSLETLVRASVALALRHGSRSKKPQTQIRLAPEESADSSQKWILDLDELTIVTLLLINSVANVVMNQGVLPNLSFYLSLSLQSEIPECIASSARYVLEVCSGLSNPSLCSVIEERLSSKSDLSEASKRLPNLFQTTLPSLQQIVLEALFRSLKQAGAVRCTDLLNVLYQILSPSIDALGLGPWRVNDWKIDDDIDEASSPFSKHQRRSKLIKSRQCTLPPQQRLGFEQALKMALVGVHDLCLSSRITPSLAALMPRIFFGLMYILGHIAEDGSKPLADSLLAVLGIGNDFDLWNSPDHIEVYMAIVTFLCHLDFQRLELPITELLRQAVSSPQLPLNLRGCIIELCARSFWSCVERDGSRPDHAAAIALARQTIFTSTDKAELEKIFATYKSESKTTKSDSLVGMIDELESLDRIHARRTVGALFSLFGSSILFENIPLCKIERLDSFDILQSTDFIIDSGLYIVEALSAEGGCLGGCDLETWQKTLAPNLAYCKRTRLVTPSSSSALYDICSRIEFLLRSSLTAFLINRTSDRSEDYIKVILSQISEAQCPDNPAGLTSLADILRWCLKDFATQPSGSPASIIGAQIIQGTWQNIFSWTQKVLVEGSKQAVGELVSASRDLLATICGVIPNEFTEQLYALLIQQQNALATQMISSDSNSQIAIYCVYVELLAIHLEEKKIDIPAALVQQVMDYTISKLIEFYNTASQQVAPIRAWSHVLIRLLECTAYSHQNDCLKNFESLLQTLYSWRANTDVSLWKTRMQVWEAVLKEICRQYTLPGSSGSLPGSSGSLLVQREVLVHFLIQGPLIEACLKTASVTSVTRRRSRRCLSLLLEIFKKLDIVDRLCGFLMVGMSSSAHVIVQRGFANAATHLLEECQDIMGDTRGSLESILSLTKPICFNMDKKSSRSSRVGSQMTRSTKRSTRSRRSISSQYKPLRA